MTIRDKAPDKKEVSKVATPPQSTAVVVLDGDSALVRKVAGYLSDTYEVI